MLVANYGWYGKLGEPPVIWSEQGDEWLHHLGRSVAEVLPEHTVAGHRYDDTTKPFIEVSLSRGGTLAGLQLLLGATADAVHVIAAGDEEPDPDILSGLARAARIASDRLGQQGELHAWTAIIGAARDRINGSEKRLQTPATVGPLRLESTDVAFTEPNPGYSINGWSILRSVPIRVEGVSRGYSWDAAAAHSARELRILCGLLSLAWDGDYELRDAARPLAWGVGHVPERPPWYQPPESAGPEPEDLPGQPATIPAWVGEGWAVVATDQQVLAALDAYLEGVYASSRHPSLAAVAFTAAIETVAERMFTLSRCSDCGGRLGIALSFRRALREVLPEEAAAELDFVYAARSKTVHAGRFHGGETAPGLFHTGIWNTDPTRDFRWRILWRLRDAAGLLIRRAISDDLPPKQKLVLT